MVCYGILIVGAFICSLVAHLPARVILDNVPLNRDLSIRGVDGTLWQGVAKGVSWQDYDLGEVQWQWEPLELFAGKAQINLRIGRNSGLNVEGRGAVGYSLSGPYAENVLVSVPAAQIVQRISLPAPVSATGQVELMVRNYQYDTPLCKALDGNLVWDSSAIGSPLGSLELGQIFADLECIEGSIGVKGQQENNQVAGGLDATINPDATYAIDAWFRPGDEFPSGLGKQLSWLGNPDSQGRYAFVYSGKL